MKATEEGIDASTTRKRRRRWKRSRDSSRKGLRVVMQASMRVCAGRQWWSQGRGGCREEEDDSSS